MKQYRIDELRPEDYEKLKVHLDERFGPCQIEGLYWVPIDRNLLDEVQVVHTNCQPFYFAVELRWTAITFELLIRTRNRIRCNCMRYANRRQRESIIHFADALFDGLKLLT